MGSSFLVHVPQADADFTYALLELSLSILLFDATVSHIFFCKSYILRFNFWSFTADIKNTVDLSILTLYP